jgi:four helix bundle protein
MYGITTTFPSAEKYRLVDQICRAAYSVPMNIAEGSVKHSTKERYRFYGIAAASLEEVHYQTLLSKDLRYIDEEIFKDVDDRVQRTSYLLSKLRSSLS